MPQSSECLVGVICEGMENLEEKIEGISNSRVIELGLRRR